MAMKIDKQNILIDFAKSNDNNISKKEAIELLKNYYYCNSGKYVGEILSRMVKSNKLIRVSNGKFILSNGIKNEVVYIENQKEIWDNFYNTVKKAYINLNKITDVDSWVEDFK